MAASDDLIWLYIYEYIEISGGGGGGGGGGEYLDLRSFTLALRLHKQFHAICTIAAICMQW